jgi:hypothetical protein
MSFDQSFVELVTEEFSTPFEGGNGYYVTGETKVEWGWKSFRSGMSLSDSFSPFVFGDRESVLAAKQALVDRVVASGEGQGIPETSCTSFDYEVVRTRHA